MQATLIYNRNAGSINQTDIEELQTALHQAGYHPVLKATSSQAELDPILANIEGLVIAAGGDGTIRAVATRLVGKKTPLSVLPMGTANNISKTLAVAGTPLEIIAGLKNPRQTFFDIGRVSSPWGQDYFLEGLGFGFFADLLATYDPNKGKSVLRSVEAVLEVLPGYQAYHSCLKIDGQEYTGNYMLVEVLNTTTIGPRLKFAPQADPGDGLFEIVCLHEDEREGFLSYLTNLFLEGLNELKSVEVRQGRKLEIAWTGFPIHVDGEVRPEQSERPADRDPAVGARPAYPESSQSTIVVEVIPHALEFWLP